MKAKKTNVWKAKSTIFNLFIIEKLIAFLLRSIKKASKCCKTHQRLGHPLGLFQLAPATLRLMPKETARPYRLHPPQKSLAGVQLPSPLRSGTGRGCVPHYIPIKYNFFIFFPQDTVRLDVRKQKSSTSWEGLRYFQTPWGIKFALGGVW